jgi:hypothetical protein
MIHTDDRGFTLDQLIARLTTIREQHGNLPVVVWEAKQSKYLGVDDCWGDDGAAGYPLEPSGRPVAVVIDCEEASRPHATWEWE